MFTEQDYRNYFEELENIFKKALTIYTDLLNEVGDQAIRNKLHPVTLDNFEAFRFIKTRKEDFLSKK